MTRHLTHIAEKHKSHGLTRTLKFDLIFALSIILYEATFAEKNIYVLYETTVLK